MIASSKLGEAGDTIIEVLIAIAVVSMILGITYATMNTGVLQMRDAQERTEALKLMEGQIESMKYAGGSGAFVIPPVSTTAFCVNTTASPLKSVPFTMINYPPAALSTDDLASYPAECTVRFYHIAIKHESAKLFRFYVRWERIDNKGLDQVQMVYRTL